MSKFEKAMNTLGLGETSNTVEVDISTELDGMLTECISVIVRTLNNVRIIRCTHRDLTAWSGGNVFIEIIVDEIIEEGYLKVLHIMQSFYGDCYIEPISDVFINTSDYKMVESNTIMDGRSEYYILYRR